ncbi:hypothetical protein PG990_010791 [Apiospora arundinis]
MVLQSTSPFDQRFGEWSREQANLWKVKSYGKADDYQMRRIQWFAGREEKPRNLGDLLGWLLQISVIGRVENWSVARGNRIGGESQAKGKTRSSQEDSWVLVWAAVPYWSPQWSPRMQQAEAVLSVLLPDRWAASSQKPEARSQKPEA